MCNPIATHGAWLKIGAEFTTSSGRFRCTDIGTRTIVAIKVDSATISTRLPDGTVSQRFLNGEEAEREGWFKGPPYAVAEHVFDEDALGDCAPVSVIPTA